MTDQAQSSPDMLRASWQGRALLAAPLCLALIALVLFQWVALPFLKASLSAEPPTHVTAIKSALIGFALFALLAGLATILYGGKVLRSLQYPLPNAWVWRDTPIKRGPEAVKFARMFILIGILICIIGTVPSLLIWRAADRPAHQFKLIDKVFVMPSKPDSKP